MKKHLRRNKIQTVTGLKTGCSRKAGYTLVEMLIALVLIVTLMSITWSLASLYERFLTAGRTQAMDQQLFRSLTSLIEEDLSRITMKVKARQQRSRGAESGTQTPDLADARAEFDAQRRSFLQQADQNPSAGSGQASEPTDEELGLFSGFMRSLSQQNLNLPPLEFKGTATELRITVIAPDAASAEGKPASLAEDQTALSPNSLNDFSGEETIPDSSRLVTIAWQFEAPTMTEDLTQQIKQLPNGLHRIQVPTLQLRQYVQQGGSESASDNRNSVRGTSSNTPGSVRRTGNVDDDDFDQFSMLALLNPPQDSAGVGKPDESNQPPVVTPKYDHIPEVVYFELEYYDGASWWSTWESAEELPGAVRIHFALVSTSELARIQQIRGEMSATGDSINRETIAVGEASETTDPYSEIQPRFFEKTIVLTTEDPPPADELSDDLIGGVP